MVRYFTNIDWSAQYGEWKTHFTPTKVTLHLPGHFRKQSMQRLTTVWSFLQGKKTYISALIGISIGLSYFLGYMTQQQFQALELVTGAFGLIGIRSAMNKFDTGTPVIINRPIDVSVPTVFDTVTTTTQGIG